MFGLPADVKSLVATGVPVIEDLAMSLGARIGGKMAGTFGHAAICSFYATKMLTTGHGGMILTRDRKFHACVLDLLRYDNRDDYRVRYNYSLSALQAAVGNAQLRRLPGMIRRRKALARIYESELLKACVGLPCVPPGADHVFFRYVVDVGARRAACERRMNAAGIEAKRPVYKPLHLYMGLSPAKYPFSERAHSTCLSLPIYPAMPVGDVRIVSRRLLEACN
jgi:perosamine synthetase